MRNLAQYPWGGLLGLVLLAGLAGPGAAETVVLSPSKDNTLYESATGTVSNGAGPSFFAGRTNVNSNSIRRGVLAFDVAGSIPAGATINSTSLALTVTRVTFAGSPPATVAVHRLSQDWGEGASAATIPQTEGRGVPAQSGDATWLHTFFNTGLWQTPGGDFDPTASASASVGGLGQYTWSSAAMAADVQGWLNNPGSNFGWAVLGDESPTALGSARQFASRQNATVANRPALTIDFTTGPSLNATLTLNGSNFVSGDTTVFTVGISNNRFPAVIDLYFGMLAPDLVTVRYFTPALSQPPATGSLANLGGLIPVIAGFDLSAGSFTIPPIPVASFQWDASQPPGQYIAFLLFTRAGALTDGQLDPGDLIVPPFPFAALSFAP